MIASIHEFVVAKLLDKPREFASSKAYWRVISQATGVYISTIQRIAKREIGNPGIRHIETLADHFGYTPRKAAALARRQAKQQPAHLEA